MKMNQYSIDSEIRGEIIKNDNVIESVSTTYVYRCVSVR